MAAFNAAEVCGDYIPVRPRVYLLAKKIIKNTKPPIIKIGPAQNIIELINTPKFQTPSQEI
jgi:hypothetical protein